LLERGAQTFMKEIYAELKVCLEANDFEFHGMKEAKKRSALEKFIIAIQKELSQRNLNELFNSKNFNLGCSEPLLLLDFLREGLAKTNLIRKISKNLASNNLKGIVMQLHSTKTPCRSCLIGCCGHSCEGGLISSFFEEVKRTLRLDNIFLRFLITYHQGITLIFN
jgi:hypothetical protein